ncbi:Integrase catalytic domain-containing protein, partial [Aphis craccivora]
LNKYFKPIKSYFAARYTFYQAKQRQDESVCQWGARIKNLASKYGFSSGLTTVIRDIFVVGMCSGPIQDRLLEEDASKIGVTYSTLIEITTAKEAAINEKSGWKKEEYADLKYQKKNNGHDQFKQGFNTHKELKTKCGI